jgi:hypothetical protein
MIATDRKIRPMAVDPIQRGMVRAYTRAGAPKRMLHSPSTRHGYVAVKGRLPQSGDG